MRIGALMIDGEVMSYGTEPPGEGPAANEDTPGAA